MLLSLTLLGDLVDMIRVIVTFVYYDLVKQRHGLNIDKRIIPAKNPLAEHKKPGFTKSGLT